MPSSASSGPVLGGLFALALPVIAVLLFGFIIIKAIEVLPKLLNWFNRPKLRSEYEERRKTAMLSCPSQLKNKNLLIDFDNSSLMQTSLGRVVGYSSLPPNSIIMPDDNKQAKDMPIVLRILFYVPNDSLMLYDMSMGMFANMIQDVIFTDPQTKGVTKYAIILRGNSIEPMIGGGYHLLVSHNTPVYNIDNSLKMKQITAINAEFARTLKDVAENALRLNTAHTANLEREGGEAEVPVSSLLPQQAQQKQGV
jgi:hypothetical protein